MWEPLHAFTFDADARDVFLYIVGPEHERPRRIVLTNHAYWFVCEFRPTTHGAALYAVALHAQLYGAQAGSQPRALGRAPWNRKLILRGKLNPTPVAEGEVGRITLQQRRPGHCRAKLYLAQAWKGQKWQYEDARGELVEITDATFLVAVWRGLLEEWIEGRAASEKNPWGDWSPSAEEIALLREMIVERQATAQQARRQAAAVATPASARHDDAAALRAFLQAWVEQQPKAHPPQRSGGRPRNPDDDWAYEQVVQLGRPRPEVYSEWLVRIGERASQLADPQDSFRRAIRARRK